MDPVGHAERRQFFSEFLGARAGVWAPGRFPSDETQGTQQAEFPESPRLCFFTQPGKNRKNSQLSPPTAICSRPGTSLAWQLQSLRPHLIRSQGQAGRQEARQKPCLPPSGPESSRELGSLHKIVCPKVSAMGTSAPV